MGTCIFLVKIFPSPYGEMVKSNGPIVVKLYIDFNMNSVFPKVSAKV